MFGIKEGVQSLLTAPVANTTSSLSSLYDSQRSLSLELERLSTQLANYTSDSDVVDLRPVLAKLHEAGKKLGTINDTLKVIEIRLYAVKKELIQKSASKGR